VRDFVSKLFHLKGPVWSGTPQLLIQPSSSECVSLSWTLPDYPNGDIQKYEVTENHIFLQYLVYLIKRLILIFSIDFWSLL